MRYVSFIVLFITAGRMVSCTGEKQESTQTVTLLNPSPIALHDKPVTIKRQSLAVSGDGSYPLLINRQGDTIPSQLDDIDGDKKWDELVFVIDLAPLQTDTMHLYWLRSKRVYAKRTNIRFGVRQTVTSTVAAALSDTFYADQLPGVIGYQHYQTDGPTWENDKVGFRQYLDGRNSIDVFGKIVSYMTPDSVGIGKDGFTENNYSVMKDWGTDVLAVANSAGIGGFSLMVKDSLPRLGIVEGDPLNNIDSTIFNVLQTGPVRSTMTFSYRHWKPLDRNYFAEQTTSIDPGKYAYRNTVRFDRLVGDEAMVVSLVNSNTRKPLNEITQNKDWVILYTHDKQSVNKDSWLGLALVLPKKEYLGFLKAPNKGKLSSAYLGTLKVQNNTPVTYYALAAWDKSNPRFSDPVYFRQYLIDFVNELTVMVSVKVK